MDTGLFVRAFCGLGCKGPASAIGAAVFLFGGEDDAKYGGDAGETSEIGDDGTGTSLARSSSRSSRLRQLTSESLSSFFATGFPAPVDALALETVVAAGLVKNGISDDLLTEGPAFSGGGGIPTVFVALASWTSNRTVCCCGC